MKLEVNNIVINNRNISFNIFDNETYIFYSKDKSLVSKLLLVLAGINGTNKKKQGEVLFNKENIYDNEKYFKERIYFDFKEKYLSTLTPSIISDGMKYRYNLDVDINVLKQEITYLDIRKETKVSSSYVFTKQGNTLVNYALLKSLDKKNIIVDNLLLNIENQNRINYIVDDILNKNKYNTVLIGTDRIEHFINKPVKIVMFSQNKAHIINPKNDKLLLTEDNIYLRNRLLTLDTGDVVCYHDFSKEELKNLSAKKIKYKEVELYELFKQIKKGKYEIKSKKCIV